MCPPQASWTRRTAPGERRAWHRHGGRTESLGRHRAGKAEPSAGGGPVKRPSDVLEGPVLVRCPSCRNTFSTEGTGLQDCPVCGKPLLVPESPVSVSTGPQSSLQAGADPSVEQGTPWERRAELGPWRALWE